jgi:nitroimidazol reductase NimA-like FMN-containing flavoprotein (pyridoxamine 5'-phosphate oxidase superfamily)
MSTIAPTDRTKVRRLAARGNYDREVIYKILDEGLICHVGFVLDGSPRVIPTGYVRVDDNLYIHGSPASAMLSASGQSPEICVTITILDALVLARSAFHHSMNYRSVVVFGQAQIVDELKERLSVLHAFTEHIIPGRWAEVRQPTEGELKGTKVLRLPLTEASAKIRTGGPIDDEVDYEIPVWAGELPLHLTTGKPVVDSKMKFGMEVPSYAANYRRGGVNTEGE